MSSDYPKDIKGVVLLEEEETLYIACKFLIWAILIIGFMMLVHKLLLGRTMRKKKLCSGLEGYVIDQELTDTQHL